MSDAAPLLADLRKLQDALSPLLVTTWVSVLLGHTIAHIEAGSAPPTVSRKWLASMSDTELEALANVLELEADRRLNAALEQLRADKP